MKNILITGITGSGGSYLAEYILEYHPEYKVLGLHRWHSAGTLKNIKNIEHKIELIEADLTDMSSVIRALQKCKPVKIFHLAAFANVRKCFDTPVAVVNNNVMGTANLLEAVRLVCPETTLQICSTSEVYGNPQTFPMTEMHQMKPVNPYSVSKLAGEALAFAYYKSWNLNIIITRAFAYINPRRMDLFATAFAKQIVEIEQGKRKVLKHGNLESIRTIIDVRDMMRAYWLASNKCDFGVPYNIGGNNVYSVGQILEKLKKLAKVPIISEIDTNLLRPVDVTKQICDDSFFRSNTGFACVYSLEESLDFLLNQLREESK